MSKLDEIAAHAQTHVFSAEMEQGVWETNTHADPMVTTALRPPKSLLDWVRDQAIDPEWTMQAAGGQRRIVRDPDPRSRTLAIRVIGYSRGAGFVVTVIVDPADGAGITAWKTTARDHRRLTRRLTILAVSVDQFGDGPGSGPG